MGYVVHIFEHPSDALSKIRDGETPDLLISDFNLPHMNGYLLHLAIKELLPEIRTIIISGRKVRHEVGSLPFLQKPFPPDHLISLVVMCNLGV